MSETRILCLPEWAPQGAVWVGWPRLREEWGDAFDLACLEVAGFVRALADYAPVKVVAGDDAAADSAYAALGDVAEIHRLPSGDIWLRDTGALFVQANGAAAGLVFRFNGWGGKYVMEGDAETAAAMCAAEAVPPIVHDFILEGGAIDQDGAGVLLTTRQCLLNPNRNPGWTHVHAEAALRTAFGAQRIIWLDEGLLGDHTDGHIDNIARFVGPGRVVCQQPSGEDDPNTDVLRRIECDLRAAGLEVTCLPSPGRIEDEDGASMPASHMNFLITNGAVLMPAYENVYSAQAAAKLADVFPGRQVLALPARHILAGGGAFHCMTQQTPDWTQTTEGPAL